MKTRFSYSLIIILAVTFFSVSPASGREKLPREVTVASVTLMSMFGSPNDPIGTTADERIERVIERMKEAAEYNPDIICLPEVFVHTGLPNNPPAPETAEDMSGPIVRRFAGFAHDHNCYVICPMYTRHNGHVFNAAVLIDRKGNVVGEYDKIHPTEGEIEGGITPGPVDPPVFKTDFGTIGMMICFDANWPDKWRRLKEKGAEIVFWPSAFAGGKMMNSLAISNRYYIVSSTRYQPARLVDMTGEDIFGNGRLQPWFCTTINLDRKIFHWDYQGEKFNNIQAKYGNKIGYEIAHPEGWFILESRSADVSIAEVAREFSLVGYDSYIKRATAAQDKVRP